VSCRRFDREDPTSVVWREVLWGVFSTLGRLRAIANCRRPDSGRYIHTAVRAVLGMEEENQALRTVHDLVWSEWISGSIEQQQADLFLHLCDFQEDVESLLEAWSEARLFGGFIPDSASEEERTLFANNLSILLALLSNQYCLQRPRVFPKAENALMERVLETLREEYARPGLTLGKLAQKLGRTKGHLGRVFKQCTGRSFHDYSSGVPHR